MSPPRVLSFEAFGKEIGVPFLDQVSLAAYGAMPPVFDRFARKIGFKGTHDQYRIEVEKSLRATILHLTRKNGTKPDGICLRLFNEQSVRSHRLLERLHLPKNEIDVIEWFGRPPGAESVKRAIRQRSNHGLPFLVAVTNRARMGDAFPREVEWFLEFSNKAANLNSLLQGLLGRACGYAPKTPLWSASDENARTRRGLQAKARWLYL